MFEVNNDAKMKRTMGRPLPSGRITVRHAVTWASIVGCTGTALLASKVIPTFFYVTWAVNYGLLSVCF